ncbi:hypothetical protein BC936DRAFT_139976 [Jimgerdemannia flammicorona]|uniref:Uncharacterized protein n=1 Tax=Jimgerdemannia flammicorona TaxID=994334 RepID=A0A433B8W0_9FUNG|nr:hypothetical protein BC936DRAFT_139976 [Jimgerdemannia flammicorona]
MEFVVDWEVDKYDCPEMRTGQPRLFQANYWDVAGVAHVRLRERYIEVVENPARDGLATDLLF